MTNICSYGWIYGLRPPLIQLHFNLEDVHPVILLMECWFSYFTLSVKYLLVRLHGQSALLKMLGTIASVGCFD